MIVNPGIRRYIGSAVRRLLNGASVALPLTHTAIPERGNLTPSFTRAGSKYHPDFEGRMYASISGEWAFRHVRRVENLWTTSSVSLANGANKSLTLAAGAYQFSMGAGTGTATFSGTGGATGTLAASASGRVWVAKTISAGTLVVTASVADLVDLQVVSMVGVTDQTTLREYVSVGALDYRSTQNPLYLSLPGTAGHYASTPDSAAASVTGDIDIRVKCALTDWTPALTNCLVAKDDGVGQRSYNFNVQASGALRFFYTNNGNSAVGRIADSSAINTFAASETKWVRVTYASATGKVNFYYSSDGSTWTPLGIEQTITSGAIHDGTAIVELGSQETGTTNRLTGAIFSAQIYNTIGGTTPVVDFNPHRDATTPTGTITSYTTGEIWTINGASSVVRSAAYHGSMVDGVRCFSSDYSGNPLPTSDSATYPMLGSYIEPAATNSLLHNRDLTNAAWVKTNCTAAKNATGPDGVASSASTLTATGAAATCLQTLTLAAAARSYSVMLKRKTGTGAVSICRDGATFTDVTSQVNSTTWTTVSILGTSVLNPVCGIKLATSGDEVYVDFNQDEVGTANTSVIPTTTIAVTRPADVASYTGADVANIKTLAATFRRESGVSAAGTAVALSDNTANEYQSIGLTSATAVQFNGVDGGAAQWSTTASNTYTAATQAKAATSAATNNILMDLNGTAQTADITATLPTVTQIQVAHLNGAAQLNGCLKDLYGWTTNKSQSELSAVDR
jgi:hypothetical protein